MARIFITGAADGLGQLTAGALIGQGHRVVIHARNDMRGKQASNKLPGAERVLSADLSSMEETKELASKVNALGTFDVIIHNAGVFRTSAKEIFAVNTLAPYILTCLIEKPKRLIYLSSDLHKSGHFDQESFRNEISRVTYSDTKLHVLMLCKAVARKWPGVYANALSPGWVPTKMGGPAAPDSLESGYQTQVWLAVSNDEKVKVSGRYFYHQKEARYNPEADNESLQDRLLNLCKEITGVSFPEA
jgi:NAD(P)-dependent dehydrogenase (short-subunit alcohol dehydrogenase family)